MVGQERLTRSEAKHTQKRSEAEDSGLNIVDVIGEYVHLKRSGRHFEGRCPFHMSDGKGKGRPLVVWPGTQTWKCFRPGCKANVMGSRLGRKLGVLDFLELIEDIPADLLPGPDQESPQVEPSQELKHVVETLPLPLMAKLAFSRISYSMLESYQLCALRFKYTYVEHQDIGRATFSQRLGLSIHIALSKFYHLRIQDRTVSALHQLLDENRQSSPRDIEDTHWHQRAHEWLQALYDSEGIVGIPIALERSFTFPVEDFVVFGRVDRVDKISAGNYEVIDYKVLEDDPQNEREAIDSLQSVCLYFGVNSLFKAFPTRITYLHVDTGVRISFTPTRSSMEDGLSRIKTLVKEMREATDFPATQNRFCSACQLHGRCLATR